MLRYLSVTDFALVRAVAFEVPPGLTILTGETGAGKSILMDALGIALGGRSSAIAVRDGASRAVIQASFDGLPARLVDDAGLADLLGDASVDEVILVRELPRDGKGRATINGRLVPVARLRELGDVLADLHGQGDQQSLLSPAWQLRYLDGIAGLAAEAEDLRGRHRRLHERASERDRLAALARDRGDRLEKAAFERDELQRAKLRAGEEDELLERRKLLGSREKVAELVAEALGALSGSGTEGEAAGALDLLGRLERILAQLVRYREALAPAAATLPELTDRLRDLEGELQDLQGMLEFDPAELDRVEARLHELDRLKRKHGTDVDGLVERLHRLEEECRTLEGVDGCLADAEKQVEAARTEYVELALRMSVARAAEARGVERDAEALLADLSLPAARVVFQLSRRSAPDPTGLDEAEILVSLNPGEAARPLRKVASGGEVSRLMLALKLLAARDEGPETLVFDEIDVGVSGRAAEAVGRKLKELGTRKQVLCITHLPQVACFGHTHIEVKKRLVDDRAVVEAVVLSPSERRDAIARLLAGAEVTSTARKHAEELLSRAQEG